jgi:hypothetical protein
MNQPEEERDRFFSDAGDTVQRRKERAPSCTNNTLRVPTLSHVLWKRRDALGAWLNAAAGCGADC